MPSPGSAEPLTHCETRKHEIKASLSNLVAKIKGGSATSGDADSTNSLFEQLKSGTGFTTPSNSSLPGLG